MTSRYDASVNHDERIAALWMDWWWNDGPIETTGPSAALEDLRTLRAHLRAHGFDITRIGGAP